MSYIANSVNEGKDVYLVDLGNDHNRWMEVKQWKAKGCKAYTKGPYERPSDEYEAFWDTQRSYEWLRKWWCLREAIEVDQHCSPEEEKLKCEFDALETKKGQFEED